MRMNRNSTIPVYSNKSPSKRSRDNWDVNESRVCIVTEVQRRQIDEVDDQNYFSPYEVTSNKEHDECKLQEIVEDEMTSNTSSCLDMLADT